MKYFLNNYESRELNIDRGNIMPLLQRGLARPADESMLARDRQLDNGTRLNIMPRMQGMMCIACIRT